MLKNAYLLAKIGADTAENERHFAEISPIARRVADRREPRRFSGGEKAAQRFHAAGLHRVLDEADRLRVLVDAHGVLGLLLVPPRRTSGLQGLGLAELGKLANFCKFLAGSFSAVSKRNFARKYAFDNIFQALLHRCNLNILAKNRSEKSAIPVKFQPNFCKFFASVAKFAEVCEISNISAR